MRRHILLKTVVNDVVAVIALDWLCPLGPESLGLGEHVSMGIDSMSLLFMCVPLCTFLIVHMYG